MTSLTLGTTTVPLDQAKTTRVVHTRYTIQRKWQLPYPAFIASDHQSIHPTTLPCPRCSKAGAGEEWREQHNVDASFSFVGLGESCCLIKFQRHQWHCMVWSRNVPMTSSGRSLKGGTMDAYCPIISDDPHDMPFMRACW